MSSPIPSNFRSSPQPTSSARSRTISAPYNPTRISHSHPRTYHHQLHKPPATPHLTFTTKLTFHVSGFIVLLLGLMSVLQYELPSGAPGSWSDWDSEDEYWDGRSGIGRGGTKLRLWQFQHLTVWGLFISLLVFTLALLDDCFYMSTTASLKRFFLSVAYPLEGIITILYWTLLFYDEALILQPGADKIPLLIDFVLHLVPMVVCWIELCVIETDFQTSFLHTGFIFVFTFIYGWFLQNLYQKYQYWVYPVLGQLTTAEKYLMYTALAFAGIGLYYLGEI
ncbi:FAR-17a/AIG1-like protein-domain-containing protein [Paraphysoderma sedebokerense]|nr:FAR-17a/AIG1-like protein-domain-containing protein [Paraphysoderma sedebokerense]